MPCRHRRPFCLAKTATFSAAVLCLQISQRLRAAGFKPKPVSKKENTPRGGVFFFGCRGGICKERSDGIAKPQASVSHGLRVIAARPSRRIVARLHKTGLARRAPCFGDFVRQKRFSIVLGSSPNEPARRTHNPEGGPAQAAPQNQTQKAPTRGAFFVWLRRWDL